MRPKAIKYNAVMSLLSELVTLISGLILPRLTMSIYGSAGNGLVGSISHFLSFSVVLRAGLGAVTRAALYKPLAEKDTDQINGIMAATHRFMAKVALIIGVGVAVFAIVYPFMVIDEYEWVYSFAMVLIMGASTVVENLFGIKNMILLQADQKYYIQTLAAVLSHILCCVISIVLMSMRIELLFVKMGTALGVFVRPAILSWYVRHHYRIDYSVKPNNIAISQRWNAFAQQLAVVINDNVDIVVITLLSPLTNVSIYNIYFMVVNNISKIAQAPITGINSMFGDMFVRNEEVQLKRAFSFVEWGTCAVCAILFGVTSVMLIPFVEIYTRSITDANYYQPLFGILMVAACMIKLIRIPYQLLSEAAGHFRQTRDGAIVEVVLNVMLSVVLFLKMELIGVMVGTIIAGGFRTIQYMRYSVTQILRGAFYSSIKNIVVYVSIIVLVNVFFKYVVMINADNYVEWILWAALVGVVYVVAVIITSWFANRREANILIERLKKKYLRKR